MKVFGSKEVKKMNTVIKVPNLGDHRICMSAVILSLVTGIKTEITLHVNYCLRKHYQSEYNTRANPELTNS